MKKIVAAILALCLAITVFSAVAESAGATSAAGQSEQVTGENSAEEKTGKRSAFVSKLKERVSNAVSEAPALISPLSGKARQAIDPVQDKIGSLVSGLKIKRDDGGEADESAGSCLPSGNSKGKRSRQGPRQYSVDFWDGLFGTWGDGISLAEDPVNDGLIIFAMELPDPVAMPETYSVSYTRLDDKKQEVVTVLERDAAGNIHYIDGESEHVFVRTEGRYRGYTVSGDSFIPWSDVSLSARTVRQQTAPFWNCADQTFIKWLGMDAVGETEYLGRSGICCHSESGTITFTYLTDMVFDDETGICLYYTADELLKGATFSVTEDQKILIDIGDYDIGGEEMNFNCIRFETENVSFALPVE